MDTNQPGNQELKGRISSVAVVDLRHMKSVDELRNIMGISSVGVILLSDTFQGTLASIPMSSVGSVIRLPEGSKVNQDTTTTQLVRKILAAPGLLCQKNWQLQ